MNRLFIVLAIVTLLGCSKQNVVSEQELKDYVMDPENGLRKQTLKNGIYIEVVYRPRELIVAQQLNGLTDPGERLKAMNNFKSLSYFVISLSRQGQEVENVYAGDPEKFVKVINYLSSQISRNIYLINDSDTVSALDAVYTRMFGAAATTSVMTIFDADLKRRNGAVRLIIEDTNLNIGKNEFEFDLSDIKKAPTLNLD